MSFQFRNIQTFIRNCIEPHIVALKQVSTSRFKDLLNQLSKMDQEHLELLNKLNQELRDEMTKLVIEVDTKIESISTIEIGWVCVWPVATLPKDIDKWLLCNGDIFNTTKYKDLANLLQSNTTPDYRGYFLRGVGGNSAALGVHQGDRIRNITGAMGNFKATSGSWSVGALYVRSTTGGSHDSDGEGAGTIGFDASRVVPTGPENNPVNKAVQYWIRALT